jgi:hypothetical protein
MAKNSTLEVDIYKWVTGVRILTHCIYNAMFLPNELHSWDGEEILLITATLYISHFNLYKPFYIHFLRSQSQIIVIYFKMSPFTTSNCLHFYL